MTTSQFIAITKAWPDLVGQMITDTFWCREGYKCGLKRLMLGHLSKKRCVMRECGGSGHRRSTLLSIQQDPGLYFKETEMLGGSRIDRGTSAEAISSFRGMGELATPVQTR